MPMPAASRILVLDGPLCCADVKGIRVPGLWLLYLSYLQISALWLEEVRNDLVVYLKIRSPVKLLMSLTDSSLWKMAASRETNHHVDLQSLLCWQISAHFAHFEKRRRQSIISCLSCLSIDRAVKFRKPYNASTHNKTAVGALNHGVLCHRSKKCQAIQLSHAHRQVHSHHRERLPFFHSSRYTVIFEKLSCLVKQSYL